MSPLPLQTRRQAIQRLGGGFGAVGLADLLAHNRKGLLADAPSSPTLNPLAPKVSHFAPKAKRVIYLFMNGGPSQVDTFDPKPLLEKYSGKRPPGAELKTERKTGGLLPSPFKFNRCGESGIEVSEIFPHISRHIDDICVIRSMHTAIPNHEPALLMMNSGEVQPTRPSMGSWLVYGLGSENQNLPGFVALCPGIPVFGPQLWSNSFLPGVYQGTHINQKTDPQKIIAHINNKYLSRAEHRSQLDLLTEMNRLHLAERRRDSNLEARIQSFEMAFRMQFEAQEVFSLKGESARTLERYGSSPFSRGCLIARRLAERGVRVTQLYYGDTQPWDDHEDILNHRNLAGDSDRPIAALLEDLKERGLFEETLVLWGGEFGRTPVSEKAKGRDHNHHGFSVWMAGGGVKGGMVYGSTDDFGFAATEDKVHVHDLHATILHLMGLDHERLTYRYSGRDFRLTDVYGRVVKEIIA